MKLDEEFNMSMAGMDNNDDIEMSLAGAIDAIEILVITMRESSREPGDDEYVPSANRTKTLLERIKEKISE